MSQKTHEQMNREAVDFANNPNRTVAPGPGKKAMMAGAIVVGTVGGMLGVGQSAETEAPDVTGKATGEVAGQNFNPNREVFPSVNIADQDVKSETSETPGPNDSIPKNNNTGGSVDPATKEAGVYEDSEAFSNNDGHTAVDAERQANSSEG